MNLRQLAKQLERRRLRLGMSCAVVAQRTGLGLRTIQRALTDDPVQPEFDTLAAIARALGASLRVDLQATDVNKFRKHQARWKAARLVSIAQGTSALEAQAVPKRVLVRMRDRTAMELLVGSPRKLWG